MGSFKTLQEIVEKAYKESKPISLVMLENEVQTTGRSQEDIWQQMTSTWEVMKKAVKDGLHTTIRSRSGLTGGDAYRVQEALAKGMLPAGHTFGKALSFALAVAETNAAMGKIVAAPTAGSAGVLPGVLLAVAEDKGFTDEQMAQVLFTAAGIGMVIAHQASISGAEGGCQAECGSAAAMTAGAVVELFGGTPEQVAESVAISLKTVLGLVCDPVAGLVEVPCIKRNAMGAGNALMAADLALAGVKSVIPPDEVIQAMGDVGRTIPAALRETTGGGLAVTPTARKIERRISLGEEEA